MFISKIAEKKIKEIIKQTAKENEVKDTDVNFILKLNEDDNVIVIPYFQNKKHSVMYIKDFLN